MKIKRWSVTLTQLMYIIVICIAVLRSMQFQVSPGDNMDLQRHFYMIDQIKQSEYSLVEYVFFNGDIFTSNISLKFAYTFNIIMYLVAKYCNNYYIVAWLFVFIDYCIITYIGNDWWKSQGGRKGLMWLFELMLCFSLLPFFQAVSGLRTALAACLMALAIYLFLYKRKIWIRCIIPMLISSTVHPVFIMAIPFMVLAKYFRRKTGILISVIACTSIPTFAALFIRSSNHFLYSIAFKYIQYTGKDGYRSTRFCYYGVIVIGILTLTLYLYSVYLNSKSGLFKEKKENFENKIYNFIVYFFIFILSNIGGYEMVLRPAYLLGAMAPIVTGLVFNVHKEIRKKDGVVILIQTMLFFILMYVSIMYLRWHSEYYVVGWN